MREFRVDFPYAGMPQIDPDGYFKVYFTKDQYENLKTGKVRIGKNIYIPSYEEKGSSTARFEFPASKLSRDKRTGRRCENSLSRPARRRDRSRASLTGGVSAEKEARHGKMPLGRRRNPGPDALLLGNGQSGRGGKGAAGREDRRR